MIKADLWETVERERRAIEYIEQCALRRAEKRFEVCIVVGSIIFLLLATVRLLA